MKDVTAGSQSIALTSLLFSPSVSFVDDIWSVFSYVYPTATGKSYAFLRKQQSKKEFIDNCNIISNKQSKLLVHFYTVTLISLGNYFTWLQKMQADLWQTFHVLKIEGFDKIVLYRVENSIQINTCKTNASSICRTKRLWQTLPIFLRIQRVTCWGLKKEK